MPLEDKLAMLVHDDHDDAEDQGVLFATALANFNYEWKYLATSEGSFIEQVFFYTTCGCSATAAHRAQVKTRSYQPGSMTRGYEFVTESNLPAQAERVAAEAVEHSRWRSRSAPGVKDLVLLPSHLALTIHEIIAHPTELDRIVGYEANYAGTSFVKIADLGKLKYGSKWLNIDADRTHPGGMSTVGYRRRRGEGAEVADHQGRHPRRPADQPRDRALHRREGISRGCTFANHWRNYPFLRMPNIQMRAGPAGLADGRSDDRRREGRRAGRRQRQLQHRPAALQRPVRRQRFWEIKNGKKTRMVTDFTYNAITTDFWANLDAVGPPEAWEHHGMGGDAKGQPVQSNRPSHGSSPCLIRKSHGRRRVLVSPICKPRARPSGRQRQFGSERLAL